MADGTKQYSVFRKTFHVPKEWMRKPEIQDLVQHKYAVAQSEESFRLINTCLTKLGYNADNRSMVHDYLHYMIMDLLDKNGEIYLTENDIKQSENIHKLLLKGLTPDFIIKKKEPRKKTIIIDIYVGDKTASEIKGKYRNFDFFAEFFVVTQHDFQTTLANILPADDIDYLYKNFQIFLVEYHYWRACMKFSRILFNDEESVPIQSFPEITVDQMAMKEQYRSNLEAYAVHVNNQADI
eukprot:GILJ01009965.1.p1 GENE.GILJ01009965.1~~GILJ01009965.1.p1  ORF type:complete len:255 (-),score=35.54 GILJ01009965.1:860-1573(-)